MVPSKIAIIVVSVLVATGAVVIPLAILLPKRCRGECGLDVLACGESCPSNSRCVGRRCDDPDATCEDGACVVRHACSSAGECVPTPGGPFMGPASCSCGLCENGACVSAYPTGGGVYASVSECEDDAGARCTPSLGWACDADATNDERCSQVEGGAGASRDECTCWACTGDFPGPGSLCAVDVVDGEFNTYQDCFDDETKKCGWLYQCATP